MKFHCINSVELILLKYIPRGHPNPCSRVGLSCSIFKNTSATCAYPLVSNARKLKRDKRTHACAPRKAPSRTRHVREGALRKIYVFPQIYTFQKTYVFWKSIFIFLKAYIFFVRPLLVHRTLEFVCKIPLLACALGRYRTYPKICRVIAQKLFVYKILYRPAPRLACL